MRTSTISSIALINDRNRKNNILRAEQGIKAEVERARVEGHIDDPFTRRKTQPVLSVAKSKVISFNFANALLHNSISGYV